jgi:hypothetical protein
MAGGLTCCGHKDKDNVVSTEALMKQINNRYYGKWFTQVKFSQTADSYQNDSLVNSESWDEEYNFPSNLVIYTKPGDTSYLYICRNDSVIIYEHDSLISATHETHDAIILSMDIYNMTYSKIMERWKDLPYDISKFHKRDYNDKNIYVIGALEGDTTSNQVWFDAENLYLIKLIKQKKNGLREVEFLNYQQLENGWIEQEVVFKLNGKVKLIEKYTNIKASGELSQRNDAENLDTAGWIFLILWLIILFSVEMRGLDGHRFLLCAILYILICVYVLFFPGSFLSFIGTVGFVTITLHHARKTLEYSKLPDPKTIGQHQIGRIRYGQKQLLIAMLIDHIATAIAVVAIIFLPKISLPFATSEFILFSKCFACFRFLNCWIFVFAQVMAYRKYLKEVDPNHNVSI